MKSSELMKMYELEDTYWWFVGRRELVRELVRAYRPQGENIKILDVGCGTGATLREVADLGEAIGIDRSPEALQYCRQRGLARLILGEGEALPVRSEAVEIALALDLLEHIEDDQMAARELSRILKSGGILIVTAPAYPELWSEHDEALDHYRRYRSKRLGSILEGAGFKLLRLSPVIALLLLPIGMLRFMQRMLPKKKGTPETAFIVPPKLINWGLILLLRLERIWLRQFNLPAGVSFVAVARKEG